MAGYPPEFNLIIKAGIIVVILAVQSPALTMAGSFLRARRRDPRQEKAATR